MEVEPPGPKVPRTYTRTPAHLKGYADVRGLGREGKRALAARFPSEADLAEATEPDFKNIKTKNGRHFGAVLAQRLYAVKTGAATTDMWSGEKREIVWNKRTRKKVQGAQAPRVSEVDAWLAMHSETYEKYTGQDLEEKGPTQVPDACKIDEREFETIFSRKPFESDFAAAFARLPEALHPYELKALESPESTVVGLEFGSLHLALLQGAAAIQADYEMLHKTLNQLPTDAPPASLLGEANTQLKRPIWVWVIPDTMVGGASSAAVGTGDGVLVFQYDGQGEGGDGDDPEQVTPLRLAQAGRRFFALVELENGFEGNVVFDNGVNATVEPAQLPDLKEDVARALDDAQAQIEAIETWSRKHPDQAYDLSAARSTVDELRKRLSQGSGLDAAFLGDNGIGKSTICNLLVLNSSVDEDTYKTRPDAYVPEALMHVADEDGLPTFKDLLADPAVFKKKGGLVQLLTPPEPVAAASAGTLAAAAAARVMTSTERSIHEANEEYKRMEDSIKAYCVRHGNKPNMKNFVLPVGGVGSTTAMQTRLRFGSVAHLLVEHYSVLELQQQAFKFVQLMRELDGDDPRTLAKDLKKELLAAWHVYLNIKNGPYKRGELPMIGKLPKDLDALEQTWQDIMVGEKLLDIVSSTFTVYLGTGEALNLDRRMVHDRVSLMNDKEQLYRYAVKSLDNFQPASVLEGGNSLVDLPGQNDVDTGCMAQTREGVKEAGVVFVVLKKSLNEDESSLQLLKDSDTIKRAVAGEANVVFLFNREIQPDCRFREL